MVNSSNLSICFGSYEHANKIIAKLETRIKPLLEPKQIERLEEFTKMFRKRGTGRRVRIQQRIQALHSGDTTD